MRFRTGSAIGTVAALALGGLVWATPASAITQNDLQMPFPCNEVWNGATRNPHPSSSNSYYALDLNKGSGADDRGEEVVASAAGRVTYRGGAYGSVYLDHGAGWTTRYKHMSGIRVQEGQQVKQGQVLGLVDDIGSPGAYHLHYEQRLNGTLQHIRFNGTEVVYSFNYNGPAFTSRNCPSSVPAPAPVLNATHYTTNNNLESGSAVAFSLGNSDQEHFRGDWDGNGSDTPGRRIGNRFILSNNRNGSSTAHDFTYGQADDEIVVGDWNGDGRDSIGVVRGNTWHLRNARSSGVADRSFNYGNENDEVVAGDWDGDGIDTPGVVRENRWFLHNSLSGASNPDFVFTWGRADDDKFVGDWNGDGIDTPGVRRDKFYLKGNNRDSTSGDVSFGYGRDSDLPIVGDWDGDSDGIDTIGVIRFG